MKQTKSASARPVFIVALRAEPYVDDAVRALRAALKVLLRRFGLRAVNVYPAPPTEKDGPQ